MSSVSPFAPFAERLAEVESRLNPSQLAELNAAVAVFNGRSDSPFRQTKEQYRMSCAYDLLQHGTLDAAKAWRRKKMETTQKAKETRERNRAIREAQRQAELIAPGYVYIYRFRYQDEWLYKFRRLPAKTNRLQLFRCIWVESGALALIEEFCGQRWEPHKTYNFGKKAIAELADLPTGRPATDTPQTIVEYVYVKPEIKVNYSAAGYVYVLKGVHGYYKIGRTMNPSNRLATFSVKLPFPVEYYCVIKTDDMYTLEQKLHSKYASKRVDGEWFFNLSDHDLAFLVRLARFTED